MRQRRLRNLYERLKELKEMKKITRDELLMKLGTARKEAGRIWNIIDIRIPMKNEKISGDTFTFKINREKLREQQFKEGTYLLRTNLQDGEPEELWQRYILLTEIEQAFKELKSDLHLRPVYHQLDNRIEAHIFVSFLAYCLQITLKQQAKQHAPGITPRAILEKFKTMQMIDVHLPTTDGRELILPRYTYPEKDIALLLYKLKLKLPNQPPPKIQYQPNKCGADLLPKTQ
ncbi:transposase IS4 family protein [Candidatus Omnitrophus magneticus]|uniref:Transposase IS4 family protein n=1 Tax=Candidatus Omnitrophus magneticus TaxID=1609969 RepID=A0A0F0CSQ8_9BACT|nr:transposase IS4 family protein [Candidatus Omnitrophus magneticus]KJJ83944.1 transposase IS4 family protein [Candidatus Omnitrophus magneticus]KJJ84485.1 transposase IS4 family protein [Candidatus Omnitrophus magneticus]KJJ84538.1 transposase IS4 family protein [Candidatus Omnitrophus magneticus]KJJ84546.1 transposase IS4 family protein [Candidatus Omnitrophus magneticus]